MHLAPTMCRRSQDFIFVEIFWSGVSGEKAYLGWVLQPAPTMSIKEKMVILHDLPTMVGVVFGFIAASAYHCNRHETGSILGQLGAGVTHARVGRLHLGDKVGMGCEGVENVGDGAAGIALLGFMEIEHLMLDELG